MLTLSPTMCLPLFPQVRCTIACLCVFICIAPPACKDSRLPFLSGSAGKEYACSVGDLSLIPGLGRSPGEGKGYPLQYAGLEKSMDCIVHGVTKSQTRLSNFHFHFTFTHTGVSSSRKLSSYPQVLFDARHWVLFFF